MAAALLSSSAGMSTHAEKIEAAKRKAQEMKAAAAAKRAAKEAAVASCGGAPPAAEAQPGDEDRFIMGTHNLILVDWDDTLFPTSAWKARVEPDAAQPLRESKVRALSEAISEFVRALQRVGDVRIVTHACESWYDKSSAVLLPETKALLDSLPAKYRDSYGNKYMVKKPPGLKYMTDIGSEVDNYAEWYKTDMFFHFVSEKQLPRQWDETHRPPKVALPRQVLVVGDGSAEKRSYDELGNQARLYATRPGHAAVARVGLKGVFYKDGPSFEELLLQLRWAAGHVASTFLPEGDAQTKIWDLTGFPEWVCLDKVGPNAYAPVSRGALLSGGVGGPSTGLQMPPPPGAGPLDELDEEAQLQLALAASLLTR